MHLLTFSPPLGSTTTLKVPPIPPHISDHASRTQTIHFEACFNSHEAYLKAKLEGVRIELWTDLPIQGQRPRGGEWRPVQFTELDRVRSRTTKVMRQSFSLLSEEDFGTLQEHTLYLDISAPFQHHLGSSYQFTYRLVYPSGHVQWLGTQDGNGVVNLEQGLPGINLAPECQVEDGRYCLESSPKEGVLACLEHPEEWTIWAWKESGFPVCLACTESIAARAVVLTPRPSIRQTIPARPLVLVAKGSSTLRLGPIGTLSSHPEPALLGLLEYSRDALEPFISLCGGFVLGWEPESVAIASQVLNIVHVLVLPITASGVAQWSSISLSTLKLLATRLASETLELFSPKLRKSMLLHFPDSIAIEANEFGNVYFSSSGAEMIVTSIRVVGDDDSTWRVALLAPSKDLSMRVERPPQNQLLPTPPPSPPALAPAVNSPTDVLRRSPEVDAATALNESSTVATPREAARRSHYRPRPYLALVRNSPTRLLRVYFHTVFNVIFWFWSVFLRAFALRLAGEGITRRISGLLGYALSMTAARQRGTSSSADEPPPCRELRLPEKTGAEHDESLSTKPLSAGVRDLDVSVPWPQYPSYLQEPEASPHSLPRVVLAAAVVQAHALPFIVLRGPGAIKKVRAQLDGHLLPAPSIIQLAQEVHLLVLGLAELVGEGQLEVSFEL